MFWPFLFDLAARVLWLQWRPSSSSSNDGLIFGLRMSCVWKFSMRLEKVIEDALEKLLDRRQAMTLVAANQEVYNLLRDGMREVLIDNPLASIN